MSWNRVRGHERWRTFGDIVRRGRLRHAYLLIRPTGVGKKLFARRAGQAVLCEVAGDQSMRATAVRRVFWSRPAPTRT